jgi:hypothetical protein
MAPGICELLWLKNILEDLRVEDKEWKTNKINRTKHIEADKHNPVQHDRTKHIEADKHFIKEKLDQRKIR